MQTLGQLRSGGKKGIARTLSALDRDELTEPAAQLLDHAYESPLGYVVGITGPPGVGKSTLTQSLIQAYRSKDRSVAVIAVDPSSKKTGGALLGDRTRFTLDPDDPDSFVRSMAARDRLGGLSNHAIQAVILLRALFDVVLVESVGIGQSDADVALVCDVAVLCVQPGSGDALQFMKAGIMEWPDIICVTKADMGAPARRALADIEGALGLSNTGQAPALVTAISAKTGEGIDELVETLTEPRRKTREDLAKRLIEDAVKQAFGTEGLRLAHQSQELINPKTPFHCIFATYQALKRDRLKA
ncbi:MAG: P-loop NTPase fold protein [Pseudomonadota bacterium]